MSMMTKKALVRIAALLFISLGVSQELHCKRALRNRSKDDESVKEYVVLPNKQEVVARLGRLYERLKLFANYPKDLKQLQEETDKLEEVLRNNTIEQKDAVYAISSAKIEVAKLRNSIVGQKTNESAKQVVDSIAKQAAIAEQEMAKIVALGQKFDEIHKQIKDCIAKINASLDGGGQEIDGIKDELSKIGAMEEAAAGQAEHDIAQQIDSIIPQTNNQAAAKNEASVSKTKSENGSIPTSAAMSSNEQKNDLNEAKVATLSIGESLLVLGKIAFKFVKVAALGFQDFVSRLFSKSSVVIKDGADEPRPVAPAAAEKNNSNGVQAIKSVATTVAAANSPSAPAPDDNVPSDADNETYFRVAGKSILSFAKASLGLLKNAVHYVRTTYAKTDADVLNADATPEAPAIEVKAAQSENNKVAESAAAAPEANKQAAAVVQASQPPVPPTPKASVQEPASVSIDPKAAVKSSV